VTRYGLDDQCSIPDRDRYSFVRFEVFTAVTMKKTAFFRYSFVYVLTEIGSDTHLVSYTKFKVE
jgi:hypothetical protein